MTQWININQQQPILNIPVLFAVKNNNDGILIGIGKMINGYNKLKCIVRVSLPPQYSDVVSCPCLFEKSNEWKSIDNILQIVQWRKLPKLPGNIIHRQKQIFINNRKFIDLD